MHLIEKSDEGFHFVVFDFVSEEHMLWETDDIDDKIQQQSLEGMMRILH